MARLSGHYRVITTVSQMTHYALIHYVHLMYYVLKHVVYELNKIILSLIISLIAPPPLHHN